MHLHKAEVGSANKKGSTRCKAAVARAEQSLAPTAPNLPLETSARGGTRRGCWAQAEIALGESQPTNPAQEPPARPQPAAATASKQRRQRHTASNTATHHRRRRRHHNQRTTAHEHSKAKQHGAGHGSQGDDTSDEAQHSEKRRRGASQSQARSGDRTRKDKTRHHSKSIMQNISACAPKTRAWTQANG